MIRPTVIIAEPEPDNALSSRKLVVETAKFNVITAHSTQELRETIEEFPAARAVIVHHELLREKAKEMIDEIKERLPNKPIITLAPHAQVPLGNYHLGSHDPEELIDLLRKLFGDPRNM
jgi:DNA-binding NtrC family response regulator